MLTAPVLRTAADRVGPSSLAGSQLNQGSTPSLPYTPSGGLMYVFAKVQRNAALLARSL